MRAVVALLVVSLLFAGCSDDAKPNSEPDISTAPPVTADSNTGGIRGVVVDQAIYPVEGAMVKVYTEPEPLTMKTLADGLFSFSGLAPGEYMVEAGSPLHTTAQTTVTVVAGEAEPDMVKLLIERHISEKAYSSQFKFNGFIQCGYAIVGVTSLCVNDYSTLAVPGGLYPDARELFDSRGYYGAVGSDWETLVVEMNWEPSAEGTSEQMFILVSHANRTSSDYFGQVTGSSPILIRFETGETHPSGAGVPEQIPSEGMDDLYVYGGIEGDNVAVGFNQEFEMIQTTFFLGKPPADWSFMQGHELPF